MKYLLFIIFLSQSLSSAPIWKEVYEGENDGVTYSEVVLKIDCPDSCDCISLINNMGFCRLVHSRDGGFTWEMIYDETIDIHHEPRPYPFRVFDMAYPDSNHLYVCYEDAIIKKSANRGKTWDTIHIGFKDSWIRHIHMVDSITGICTTGKNEIAITKSGWKEYEIISTVVANDIYMHSYEEFLIDAIGTKMYKTLDKCKTWHEFQLSQSFITNNIVFYNDSLGWLVGESANGQGHQSSDVIYQTTDRGFTWEKIYDKELDPIFGLQDIAFYDEMNGVAVGQYGKILVTTDGGKTWEREYLFEHEERIPPTMKICYAGNRPIAGTYTNGIFIRLDTTKIIPPEVVPPKLITPKNNTLKSDNSITFYWSKVSEAEKYQLKISDDMDFNNIIVNKVVHKNWLKIDSLEGHTTYYWKVALIMNDSYLWSKEIFKLQTKMAKPLIQYPECATIDLSTEIELTWAEVKGADFYKIEGDAPILNKDSILTNKYQISELDSGRTYSWKVLGYNAEEESEWSEECDFTVVQPASSVGENGIITNLSPNPTTNNQAIYISIQNTKLNNIKLKIYSSIGILIDERIETNIPLGVYKIEYIPRNFTSNSYFIVIESDEEILGREKFIIK